MQEKKTAHNKANETKNANVTARATEKVIVDKKTPEEKKEETEREEVPKSGKAKLISILSAVVLALILIFKPELLQGVIDSVTAANAEGVYAAFIDVGQGDSIFLRSPNGKTMLVDAGTPDSFESIQNVLSEEGVTKLDVVVMTHPHSDHMGSMKRVIDNYDIGTFYMPDAVNTTSSFDRMLSALEKKKVKTKVIWGSAKTTINWDGDVEVRVLSPIKGADYQDNLNDMSVVIKVTYGETSLLLTGDAESYAEELMIASEKELLQADVLKIGHHGSSTSSSQAFLDAVQPKAVVISLGKNNDYGHPHRETMQRLKKLGTEIYRTDELGTVRMLFTEREVRLLKGSKYFFEQFAHFIGREFFFSPVVCQQPVKLVLNVAQLRVNGSG
mgnify:CR=1 FL=1